MELIVIVAIMTLLLAMILTGLDIFLMRKAYRSASASSQVSTAERIHIRPAQVSLDRDPRNMELRMLDLINAERKKYPAEARFAQPLQWDESVARVAKQHSADQVRRGFVDHVNPEGEDPAARLLRHRIHFTAAAENVASGYRSVEQTMVAFMDEPKFQQNHRGNILNPLFTHVGIGIVKGSNGGIVVTQNFIRR